MVFGKTGSIASLVVLLVALHPGGAAGRDDSMFGKWGHLGNFAGYDPGGPPLGDFVFLPLNEEAKNRALSWNAANQMQPERQCFPHSTVWIPFGPTPLHIMDKGDHIAIRMQSNEVYRRIWMDGRPRPSKYALHTFNGFSTGEWQGNTLKITTTHIKEGFLRRNGVPNSDRAVVTEYLVRHDNYLTDTIVTDDPVYLTVPLVRSQSYDRLGDNTEFYPYPCEQRWPVEYGPEPFHFTRHYLPGQNPVIGAGRVREDQFDDSETSEVNRLLDRPY